MTGTIAVKKDTGFGFITPGDGGKDVFFHASALVDIAFDDLKEGDAVTFEMTDGPKGPAAADVRRAEGGDAEAPAPEAAPEAGDAE